VTVKRRQLERNRREEPRITAWSFSRWSTYSDCPRRAKHAYLDRLPDPSGPAAERGTRIHEIAEHYVKGDSQAVAREALEPPLSDFADELDLLRAHDRSSVEGLWAFDAGWKPVGWFDGARVYCRVKVDAVVFDEKKSGKKTLKTARVIDYKTGREWPKHALQVELYALAALKLFPELDAVSTELWYLDQGEIASSLFKASDEAGLMKKWASRVKPMLADTAFRPTPGRVCRWCNFSVERGGPCVAPRERARVVPSRRRR